MEDYVAATPEVAMYHAHLPSAELQHPSIAGGCSVTVTPEAASFHPQVAPTDPSPLMQLSYLPHMNCLYPGMTLAYPVMLPAPFQATLNNGQPLGVILAVLDDFGATYDPPSHFPGAFQEEPKPCEPHSHVDEEWSPSCHQQERHSGAKNQGRRDRRRKRLGEGYVRSNRGVVSPVILQPGSPEVPKIHNNLQASYIFTETGSKQVLAEIERHPESLEELASAVHWKLSDCLSNAFANSVVVALLNRMPYGRKARRNSVYEAMLVELTEALPRSCMHPLGREVYLTLLCRASEEADLPSRTTKLLVERISNNVGVMVDCSQARTVLKKALQLTSFRPTILASLQSNVDFICKTPHGCEFVSGVLRKYEATQLAMAILESARCFRNLSRDLKWSSLLVQASSFSQLHRSELAERIRSADPQDQMRLPLSVKRAALWT